MTQGFDPRKGKNRVSLCFNGEKTRVSRFADIKIEILIRHLNVTLQTPC